MKIQRNYTMSICLKTFLNINYGKTLVRNHQKIFEQPLISWGHFQSSKTVIIVLTFLINLSSLPTTKEWYANTTAKQTQKSIRTALASESEKMDSPLKLGIFLQVGLKDLVGNFFITLSLSKASFWKVSLMVFVSDLSKRILRSVILKVCFIKGKDKGLESTD